MLESTLQAIEMLEKIYTEMLNDGTNTVVRRIILRASSRLQADARKQLTGE